MTTTIGYSYMDYCHWKRDDGDDDDATPSPELPSLAKPQSKQKETSMTMMMTTLSCVAADGMVLVLLEEEEEEAGLVDSCELHFALVDERFARKLVAVVAVDADTRNERHCSRCYRCLVGTA